MTFSSGADLSAFVREASVAALKEFMAQRKAMETMETDTAVNVSDGAATRNPTKGLSDPKEIHVTSKHFEIAFEKVKPSVLGKVCFCHCCTLLKSFERIL